MRTMSISLQESLYEKLKHSIPSKKISNFVSAAIAKELDKMEEDYKEAEANNQRKELLDEWDLIDSLSVKS